MTNETASIAAPAASRAARFEPGKTQVSGSSMPPPAASSSTTRRDSRPNGPDPAPRRSPRGPGRSGRCRDSPVRSRWRRIACSRSGRSGWRAGTRWSSIRRSVNRVTAMAPPDDLGRSRRTSLAGIRPTRILPDRKRVRASSQPTSAHRVPRETARCGGRTGCDSARPDLPERSAAVESSAMSSTRTANGSRLLREAIVVAALTVVGAILRLWSLGRLGLVHFDEGIYAMAGCGSSRRRDLAASTRPSSPTLRRGSHSSSGWPTCFRRRATSRRSRLDRGRDPDDPGRRLVARRTSGRGRGRGGGLRRALGSARRLLADGADRCLVPAVLARRDRPGPAVPRAARVRAGPWRWALPSASRSYSSIMAGSRVSSSRSARSRGRCLRRDERTVEEAIRPVGMGPRSRRWSRPSSTGRGSGSSNRTAATPRSWPTTAATWAASRRGRAMAMVQLAQDGRSREASGGWRSQRIRGGAGDAGVDRRLRIAIPVRRRDSRGVAGIRRALCVSPRRLVRAWSSGSSSTRSLGTRTGDQGVLPPAGRVGRAGGADTLLSSLRAALAARRGLRLAPAGGAFTTIREHLEREDRCVRASVAGVPEPLVRFWRDAGSSRSCSRSSCRRGPTRRNIAALLEPSDSLRRACRTIAAEVPQGREIGAAFYARPPVTFYLSGDVPVSPQPTLDRLLEAADASTWALLDVAMVRQDGGIRGI